MKGFFDDCRHALRLNARTPGVSALAVVVLAVGMAFVSAFLSLYVDLILRPHPAFEQSGRIATVGQNDGKLLQGIPYGIVARMTDEIASIEAATMSNSTAAFVGPDDEFTLIELVSQGFFDTLRPRLALGRNFVPEDHAPAADLVAVISYQYWQQRFGGNRDVLGTTIEITRDSRWGYSGPSGQRATPPQQDSAMFRIVGVMPEAVPTLTPFESGVEYELTATALWIPLEPAMPLLKGVRESLPDLVGTTFVRLRPGISAAAVARELDTRYGGQDSPFDVRPGARLDAIEGIVRNFTVQREAKHQLQVFLAGSVLLALVAAANVSLFLLARAPSRSRELGVRLAVGAPLRRLARQLATEAGLLVVVSVTLGLLLSVWLSNYLKGLAFVREAEWHDVTLLEWRVLSLIGVVALIVTLLVAMVPILSIRRLGIAASSRQVMARASPAQRIAGVVQIGIAGTLSGAAIAFAWHVGPMMFGDPGYELADRYVVGGIAERSRGRMSFADFARQRAAVEAIPGVTAVGYGFPVPGERLGSAGRINDPDDSSHQIDVYWGVLDGAFIDVLGLDLVHGRAPADGEDGIVVVNQTFARAAWGHDEVVGKRLPLSDRPGGESMEVIGVLRDTSFAHPSAPPMPFVFRSLNNAPSPLGVIDAQLDPAEMLQALDRVMSAGEVEVQIRNVIALKDVYQNLIAADRARGILTISTAALVILVAAFGFYGTQRYLVAAGRREYAIRASLGASPGAIGRLVVGRGLLLGAPGLIAGGLFAFTVVAWLRGDYLGNEVSPALVTVMVITGMTLVLLGASLAPAREARRTQPAPLLRED